jgi:hypothetical protein
VCDSKHMQMACDVQVAEGEGPETVRESFRGPMIVCANCWLCWFDHSLRGLQMVKMWTGMMEAMWVQILPLAGSLSEHFQILVHFQVKFGK